MKSLLLRFVMAGMSLANIAQAAPLELESKIPLGDIHGRIDHLAIDLNRQRLYVAELGNDSVGVVDLKKGKTIRTLTGLKAPQGIGYVASTDTLYVANAGDGSVRLFQGAQLTPIGQIALGQDADNIRVDEAAHRLYVGYGGGALAVLDTVSRRRIADIPLKAHPESFQLEGSSQRIFVNVPDARQIVVVDGATGQTLASWPTNTLRENFPLALDEPQQKAFAVFRHPASVGVYRMQDGQLVTTVSTCGDADDVFVDDKRARLYVSCGDGAIDVLSSQGEGYVSLCRIPTASGSRTALFIPAIDRLFVATRATGGLPASLWVFRPAT